MLNMERFCQCPGSTTINYGSACSKTHEIWMNTASGWILSTQAFTTTDVGPDPCSGKAWSPPSCLVLGDYDNDGDIDLFCCSCFDSLQNELWQNDGQGTFTKVTVIGSLANLKYATKMLDYNNDGYMDIVGHKNTGSRTSITSRELYDSPTAVIHEFADCSWII